MNPALRVFEGRSTYIDALRGVAALSVACYHITRYGPLPAPAREFIPRVLQFWFYHGWMGVQVFFVISGFVIAYSLYLIHFPMSHVVTTLGSQISGTTPSPAVATLWLVLALAASLAAAHVMYVFVEAPSVRFAARFKRPSTPGL